MDERIETRFAGLEAEIATLKAMVATDADGGLQTSDRRGVVRLLAASAVGVVTGAAIFNAQPAAAAQGDAVLAGVANTSTNATQLTASNESALIANGQGGVGIVADGGFGNALFIASGAAPSGTQGLRGLLFVDAAGDWWAATADSATDAGWRRLAGPNTAGQLQILASPVRVYDSRPGLAPSAVGPKVPTVTNAVRVLDTTANASGVPANARAVLINLTITGPQAPGFASAWASGVFPGTSSINFAAGQSIATTTVVGCGPAATIQVLANTATDFLVDVIGFYQ